MNATSLDLLFVSSHIVRSEQSLLSASQPYWFPFFYHRRWMSHFLSRPPWSGYPDIQPDPPTSRWAQYSLLWLSASFSNSVPCSLNCSYVFPIYQECGKRLVKYHLQLFQLLPISQTQHSLHYFHCLCRDFSRIQYVSIFVSFVMFFKKNCLSPQLGNSHL